MVRSQERTASVLFLPGTPQSLLFGNGVGRLYLYNNRLQTEEITDTDTVHGYGSCGQAPSPLNNSLTRWDLDLRYYWGSAGDQVSNNNGNLYIQGIYTCDGTNLSTQVNFQQGYQYDAYNRISSVSDSGASAPRSYGYDQYGNMWIANAGAGFPVNGATPTSVAAYNALTNQVTAAAYDAAGNETTIPTVCATASCVGYDAESRQVSYGNVATYAYGPDGKRVISTDNGVTTAFVYDAQGQLAATYRSASAVTPACQTCYLSWDHLGSTRMVTDQNGNLIARHDYMPFGEEITSGYTGRTSTGLWGAPDTASQKFTGKERDTESGLDYFGARFYGSALGRFTSPDWSATPQPIPYANLSNPQTLNLYAYVGNNPLSITDLDGHGWWGDFWNGLANSTYRPLVTFVEHPIVTGRNLGSAITHPIATANAIKNGVVTTTFSAVKGNGEAIGTAVGTVGMAFIPGAGEAGETAEAASDLSKVGEAGGAVADLNKSLASEEQMGQLAAGQGTPIAGAGSQSALRDADRLAAQYGGDPGDWQKITSGHYSPPGSSGAQNGFETHAYQNSKTGQVVEMKSKPDHLQ